jgi:hypothetical protein
MARPAQHRIELTEEEQIELTRRARAEKLAFQDVQRARIVLYAARGMADTEPWQARSWIFARDPKFAEKTGSPLNIQPWRLKHPGRI